YRCWACRPSQTRRSTPHKTSKSASPPHFSHPMTPKETVFDPARHEASQRVEVSRRLVSWATLFVLLVCIDAIARAQTPSYFRLDQGIAADDERPLPDRLEAEQLCWRQALASGHSTPCIVGNRIFVTGHDGNDLKTVALDRKSGQILWTQTVHVEQLETV